MTYNVILFTDTPSADWFCRGYGAYRLNSEIRNHGYTALTVDFSSGLDWDTFTKIIDKAVSNETLVVGLSVTWFPYRNKNITNPRYVVGFKSMGIDPAVDFDRVEHPWHFDSLAYNASQGNLNKYIDYIKSKNLKTKFIIGGAKSNEYVFEEKVDNVFIGYSENMIIDYLHSLSGKGPKRIFNKIINYDIKAQDPRFDFNNSKTVYVETDCLMPKEIMTFEFSRGCIFNCAFCSYPHRGQDTRNYVKYQEVIYNELLDNWTKYGVYRYVITDDTFNDYTDKLKLIREAIQRLPFKPEFWAYIRMDLVGAHPEQAQLLKDIGVKEVYYGLEAWSNDTAKSINKGGSLKNKIKGMRIAKECWGKDVYVISGIIAGLPKDTEQSIIDSVEWYKTEGKNYVDLFGYASLTLYHPDDTWQWKFHSHIEDNLEEYGYSFPDPAEYPMEWVRNDSGDITSKSKANEIIKKYNAELAPYWTVPSPWDWKTMFDWDPDFRNKTATNLFYSHVTTQYFPKLLEKI